MPYVLKGPDGSIKAASPQLPETPGVEWEFIDGNSRDYMEFLEGAIAEQDPFRESDIQLARVLEDLIALLIERDVIRFTDFPAAAQKRLIYRQALRKKGQVLDIIDEDPTPIRF